MPTIWSATYHLVSPSQFLPSHLLSISLSVSPSSSPQSLSPSHLSYISYYFPESTLFLPVPHLLSPASTHCFFTDRWCSLYSTYCQIWWCQSWVWYLGIHLGKGANQLPHAVLWPPHARDMRMLTDRTVAVGLATQCIYIITILSTELNISPAWWLP